MTETASAQQRSLLAVLTELSDTVENARGVPMSASCMVNREQILSLVDALRAGVPEQLSHADELRNQAAEELKKARGDAEELVRRGQAKSKELAEQEAVVTEAKKRAAEIIQDAKNQAERVKSECDVYCSGQLEAFEKELAHVQMQARRGREVITERQAQRAANPMKANLKKATSAKPQAADAAGPDATNAGSDLGKERK